MLTYKKISKKYYISVKKSLNNIIYNIWSDSIDARKAIEAIERSFDIDKYSFHYVILKENNIIGITWFYELINNNRLLGLNHHWILPEYRWNWLWKTILVDLISIIKDIWYNLVQGIIELVPKNNINIENIFIAMWFKEIINNEIKNITTIHKLIKQWYYSKAYIFDI